MTGFSAYFAENKDAIRDFIIHTQREMTARPALGPDNGGEGEDAKAAWLEGLLRELGLDDIERIDAPDARVPSGKRPNIAARGKGQSPHTLWVIGHTDVVPPGDLALWQGDPYTLSVDGDLICGRGVEDNQQAIATALLAAKALKDLGITPYYRLGVFLAADEETHSAYGLEYVMRARPGLFKPTDLILVPDGGDPLGETVEVAEKGCLWLKFTVRGRQCHASTPENGINSLLVCSACILALQELYNLFPQEDALFQPPRSTFAPTKKEPNVENVNTIPGLDVFYVDCRILPGINADEVIESARKLARAAAAPYGAEVELEAAYREDPAPATSLQAPVVLALSNALAKLRGLQSKPTGMGGLTVAAILRRQNIPAVVWGTLLRNPHTPNEKSSISNTIADAAIVLEMLNAAN